MIKFHRAMHQNQSAYKTDVSDCDLYFNKNFGNINFLVCICNYYINIYILEYQAAPQAVVGLCGLFCLVTNNWKPRHQQFSRVAEVGMVGKASSLGWWNGSVS